MGDQGPRRVASPFQQQQQHQQQQQRYYQQQQQMQQQQQRGMSVEEFDRAMDTKDPTRITLSTRRYSTDSVDGMDFAALSSKDAFFDFVSSSTPESFNPKDPSAPGPQMSQTPPQHRQQQRIMTGAQMGNASGRGSPGPMSPNSPHGYYGPNSGGGGGGPPGGGGNSGGNNGGMARPYTPPQHQHQPRAPPSRQNSGDPYGGNNGGGPGNRQNPNDRDRDPYGGGNSAGGPQNRQNMNDP
ncbi:hypothetical protein HK104_001895, partial [Borealophlyctis nickersoniae]